MALQENLSGYPAALTGLSATEAAARLKEDGPNELARPEHRTILRIVADVFREPMFALLIGAGVIYLLLGDLKEALILLAFATLSVVITIVQESRSERVLEALRDLTSPRALVVRDGERVRIAGRDVVRGDLIIVSEGDRVPADAFALTSHDVVVDESLLTGESVPVRKTASRTENPGFEKPGGDDTPFLFSGTLVVRGIAQARVVATGHKSEIGKIGVSLGRIELEPPRLRAQTRRIVRAMLVVAFFVSTGSALLYGITRGAWLEAALGGIAIGMSMLPEEFPLVLTVFMVMGAWRISRARVLTRRADAIEALGAATVLCTDKTGTLTENRMTVAALRAPADSWQTGDGDLNAPALHRLAHVAALASQPESTDPMEKAIFDMAPDLREAYARARLLRQYGLRPDLLAMTNVWSSDGRATACSKGAPEAIAKLCNVPREEMAELESQVMDMAGRGMRVIGVATAETDEAALPDDQHSFAFSFLGLVGLRDPLRSTVPDAVRECHSAGIRVVMITGDYPATARAIASDAGFENLDVIDGDSLGRMTDEELAQAAAKADIYARITPDQKLRIVEALKANGEVVAMTGDGVNDAPALKAAHIGVAMGARGTDVAREASALVLLDDDFASIVHTVRLGRRIYDNLVKAVQFILSVHIPIAGLALVPPLFGLPILLAPVHIAFIEMLIDPACSIVFEAEPEEGDIMRRPPRSPTAPLASRATFLRAGAQGAFAFVAVAFALVLAHFRHMSETESRALAFATLVLANIGLILANRSFDSSLLEAFRRPNPSLVFLVSGVLVMLATALFWPPARELFKFGPLHLDDLAICTGAGIAVLLSFEGAKSLVRRI